MTEKEILRNQKGRLGFIRHAEEITKNVVKTCCYFGITRTTFYRLYKRYQKDRLEGLKDRPRRPFHTSQATQPGIIAKIVYLRQTYHFGP